MSLRERYAALPRGYQLIAKAAAGVAVLLALLFVVPGFWNRVSNAWWGRGTEKQKAEIEAQLGEAQRWKEVAAGALGELENAKRQLAEEKRKREEAEKILADRRKVTDAARAEYQSALTRPLPPVDPNASTDDLCAKARALGVSCPD